MKRSIYIAFCAVLVSISTALASPRVGTKSAGVCTRDFNLWGHASQCSCADSHVYDVRSGLCLQEAAAEKIMVQGTVSSGIMAIGGETTGFTIETSEGNSYELVLKIVDQDKLSKLSGMWFEVEGELITIKGVEAKERKAIIADRVAVLE